MMSLARAEPPGEFTRITTALTLSSSSASRKAARMLVLPAVMPQGLVSLLPVMMLPSM
jgi:hypothetical protein